MIIALMLSLFVTQEESRKEWQGFPEGSWVVRRIIETDGAKQKSLLERTTVLRIEKEQVILKREIAGQEKEVPQSMTWDIGLRKLDPENVDIDGKTFFCTLYEKNSTEGGKKETLRVWLHKDLPGRVAKLERTVQSGKSEVHIQQRLARLGQRRQIGSKTITYAIVEESSSTEGAEMTTTRWLSEQVPGFVLREEVQLRQAGSDSTMARTTELIEFEVKSVTPHPAGQE